MDLFQAIILGIVQGLTEFIPVSSTAHLVFASRWTQIYGGNPEQITATMAVIQLGTLAAVILYFAFDIWNIAVAFLHDHWVVITRQRGRRTFSGTEGVRPIWLSQEAWLGWLIIIGSIPIGIVGIFLKKYIEGPGTKNLWVISIMLFRLEPSSNEQGRDEIRDVQSTRKLRGANVVMFLDHPAFLHFTSLRDLRTDDAEPQQSE
jgi:undecaprenyl-diphosphatase